MGTGDIAIPAFLHLLNLPHEVVLLVTQPDKPVGRKQVLTAPKIKELAVENEVEVIQPERLREQNVVDFLKTIDADLFVVMAYGQILSQQVLDLPKVACINVHASLLPQYRGASCIQGPIASGDLCSGVSIMHMTKGLDEGDIILQSSLELSALETGGELHDRLAKETPRVLEEAIEQLFKGNAQSRMQDPVSASYVPKLMRSDGELDWCDSAISLERKIRAYDTWPGTFTLFTDPKKGERRLKIFPHCEVNELSGVAGEILQITPDSFVVACGEGSLAVKMIQPDGAKKMSVAAWLSSGAIQVGDRLGKSRE